MTATLRLALMLLVLGAFGGVSRASADELVQVAPHRAAIWPTKSDATPPLLGFLARPSGPGRFPAVVLLHWCSGFSSHDTQAAAMLKTWRYVALALDSLGDANRCEHGGGAEPEDFDAYAALRYLSEQDFVAADRVAVMGYSMGGLATLNAVERGVFERMESLHFHAAIAYYPVCAGNSGIMTVPTLILIGDHDDWTPAKACEDMAAHRSAIGINRPQQGGVPVTLVVYPGATHAFDSTYPAHRYLGHFMQPDPDAAKDAASRVRTFLHDTMGTQAGHP